MFGITESNLESSKPQSILITAEQESILQIVREVWDYRELLLYFTWREFVGRYRQTVLGVFWGILNPIIQMVIFSLIFGQVAKLDSDGIPYPILTYTAIVPWTFFTTALTGGINSIVSNSNMIKKIYVPRLIYPLRAILVPFPNFFFALVVNFALMLWYDMPFSPRLLALPFFVLLMIGVSLGISLWLAPMNVRFRDVNIGSGFLIRMWMWVTPVAYSLHVIGEPWRSLFILNPMTGVVEGFRWAILGYAFPRDALAFSIFSVSILCVSGLLYFRRMEQTFADLT